MELKIIYAYSPKTKSIMYYLVLDETEDGYILNDLTYQDNDNCCVIKIDKDLKLVDVLNEYAQKRIRFYDNNIFLKTLKEAKKYQYTQFISDESRLLEAGIGRLNTIKDAIEQLKRKPKSKIDNTFEIGYGVNIYTFDNGKAIDAINKIKTSENFDIESLKNLVDEFTINYMTHTFSRRNGIEKDDISFYVDNRKEVYDKDKNDVFFKVTKENDFIKICTQSYYHYYDDCYYDIVDYCNKYAFANLRAYKTKEQCLTAIYQYILNDLSIYKNNLKKSITKHTKTKNEWGNKLLTLNKEK